MKHLKGQGLLFADEQILPGKKRTISIDFFELCSLIYKIRGIHFDIENLLLYPDVFNGISQ